MEEIKEAESSQDDLQQQDKMNRGNETELGRMEEHEVMSEE